MSRFLAAILCIVSIVMMMPLSSNGEPVTFPDSSSYMPPAQKGTVYVVVRHKKSFPPMKTRISIRWGGWTKSGTFDAASLRYSREGFIIKLDHKKADSLPISVSTDGYIVSIYQGAPPSQGSSSLWESVSW